MFEGKWENVYCTKSTIQKETGVVIPLADRFKEKYYERKQISNTKE